mmetsp:Transcript_20917/g.45862  ORF Transcript_20917/g.45862 Transcript_20917/m.45862 type:complete len:219 (-) Transcript_20917:1134-1790(-)
MQQLRTEVCATVRQAIRIASRSLRVIVAAPTREPQAAGDLRGIDLLRGAEAALRSLARLERGLSPARTVEHAEKVTVGACCHILTIAADSALKLVKDGVIFVEVAQLCAQVLVYFESLDRRGLHVNIPQLECQVVTAEDVPPPSAKLDVANRCNNLREEVAATRRLLLLEELRVLVTQRRCAHVRQTNIALAAAIREQGAVRRMEFRRCYHFRQVLHV